MKQWLATSGQRSATALGRAGRSAFTLIELLIVIGIIALVVGLGVPLFGVLTGSRSHEAGQNVVAAAIGQARTIALNEGKYAGLLFYVDPATERTAMTLVTYDPDGVAGPGLEDPDPFNKYKSFVPGEIYRSPFTATNGTVVVGDRAVGLASDVNATFRIGPGAGGSPASTVNNVYLNTNLVYSRLTEYLGNMRPTVRVFRAKMDPSNVTTGAFAPVTDTGTGALRRPPRNGPFNAPGPNNYYIRVAENSQSTVPVTESPNNNFSNNSWGQGASAAAITSYGAGGSSGERQLLPLNVGVQLIIQPTARADDTAATPAFPERYVRTGLIMFDPQGRLTFDPRVLSRFDTLGKALGLSARDAEGLLAGVGVVFYDTTTFRNQPVHTEADWYYQNVAANTASRIDSAYPAFNDNAAHTLATIGTTERAEESWIDENSTQLLVNRFSGALSGAQ